MALIKCQECGAKVSTTAAACPSCGAPPAPGTHIKAKPKSRKGSWLLVGGLGLFAVAVLGITSKMPPSPGGAQGNSDASVTNSADAADTPETKAATFSTVAAASLKASLRDPDSLVIERVFATKDAKYACIEYRAKNGFGGMNRDKVVFSAAGGNQSARAWNKHCVGASGFLDETDNATRMMGFVPGASK